MSVFYLESKDAAVEKIVRATFPSYKGRQFKISTEPPSRLNSYWDGGSRDYYCFYHLDQDRALPVGSNHPFFEADHPNTLKRLPPRIVLVKHCIFCGKDLGITIYANESDLALLLPESTETPDLSRDEEIVIDFTASLKNSYGGQSNIRFREASGKTGISAEQWESAKKNLIFRGYLNANGAINAKGRNARAQIQGR